MKRLLCVFALLIFVLSACSTHVHYIKNNPDRLTPGLKTRAFLKAWGEPDESYYYHDFLNEYGPSGTEFVWGYGNRDDYTPLTVVWIYKQHKKILFFDKGYLVLDTPGALPVVWRLVGWEMLPESPKKDFHRIIAYADGSKYNGDIFKGKRHGQGTYVWPNGEKYVGRFSNDRATGGWFYETTGQKVWVYQDSEKKWLIKKQ